MRDFFKSKEIFKKVYVGLGGNLGNGPQTLQKALTAIRAIAGVYECRSSHFYLTTPVEVTEGALFTNAVCEFYTSLTIFELFHSLQHIESTLGKIPKPKNASRVIDLDILFFGEERYHTLHLQVPHPKWKERLFVLIPLLDLTSRVKIPVERPSGEINKWIEVDLHLLMENFINSHEEVITKIQ